MYKIIEIEETMTKKERPAYLNKKVKRGGFIKVLRNTAFVSMSVLMPSVLFIKVFTEKFRSVSDVFKSISLVYGVVIALALLVPVIHTIVKKIKGWA